MSEEYKMRKIKPKRFGTLIERAPKAKEETVVYPKIRFDLETLPEARKWKIGSTYRLVLDVKQVGISDTEYNKGADFDIMAIRPVSKK